MDSVKFDKIIQVSERSDTANEAQFRLGFKYYASAVGLVADKQTDFDYLQQNGKFIGYLVISSGTTRFKKIIGYGQTK